MTEARPPARPARQRVQRVGQVVSDKMQKTVVVVVELVQRHRLYGKLVRKRHRYKAHDEHNQCRIGDVVRIEETRPLSKEKRWRVVEILRRGTGELWAAERAFQTEVAAQGASGADVEGETSA
ncbi:MAG: 30S ribosomal protein S17 [Chloroflexi bacterium]|nr:30S ribosomal protein S17 [Chloroflexota bacterium]